MTAAILDGKAVAAQIRSEVAERVRELADRGVVPGLAAVLVGDDQASRIYVGAKHKACADVGIRSEQVDLPVFVTEAELLATIRRLNRDPEIHGIIVQLPVPQHLDELRVQQTVDPVKDVDGLHPTNVGLMVRGEPSYPPATPYGIVELLLRSRDPARGGGGLRRGVRRAGWCPAVDHARPGFDPRERHRHDDHMRRPGTSPRHTRNAPTSSSPPRGPEMITGEMVKPGATVVDVGVHRTEAGIVGDVLFEEAAEVAGAITPVPGGVGPDDRRDAAREHRDRRRGGDVRPSGTRVTGRQRSTRCRVASRAAGSGRFAVTAEVVPPRGRIAGRGREARALVGGLRGCGERDRQPAGVRAYVAVAGARVRRARRARADRCSSRSATGTGSPCRQTCSAPGRSGRGACCALSGDPPRDRGRAGRRRGARPERARVRSAGSPAARGGGACLGRRGRGAAAVPDRRRGRAARGAVRPGTAGGEARRGRRFRHDADRLRPRGARRVGRRRSRQRASSSARRCSIGLTPLPAREPRGSWTRSCTASRFRRR